MTAHAILPRSVIASICQARDAALARMTEAAAALSAAYDISADATQIATAAHGVSKYYGGRDEDSVGALFRGRFDAEHAIAAYRRQLDRNVWTHLIDNTGMKRLMDHESQDDLQRSLAGDDVPEATEENVRATLEGLFADADLIFKRGLANAFSGLDRRFKSHDGFKIGSRVIFDRAFDAHGWMTHGGTWDVISDVERVMAVLAGDPPDMGSVEAAVRKDRSGIRPQQSTTEARYFRLKAYKNGNAHLWFTRDDLVEKANRLLAEYYGEVLPDAYADGPGDHQFRGTDVAKDLQFYRSPPAVVEALLEGLGWPLHVLEPSAGDGAIALTAAARGATVRAIEVDESRCDLLRAKSRHVLDGIVTVERTNFLKVPPSPVFDVVLMNPPFYGTHWMDHVRHAFDFLAPGGLLRSVLPASAEVNETTKHDAFRKWAVKFNALGWRGPFRPLPAESFAESGTRIQTVIIELRRPR